MFIKTKIFLAIFLLLFLCGGLFSQELADTTEKQSVDHYLKGGRKYASEGKFEEAESEFRKVLEIDDSNRSAKANLEVIGDFEKGKINYDYALHYFKGINYLYNDANIPAAIEEFDEAIKINPDYAGAYSNLGIAYGYISQHKQAVDYLKKALQINPDDASLCYNLGVAYDSLGQHEQAIVYYEKANQISSADSNTYVNLGISYYSSGKYQEAISSYEKAIQINPNDDKAYNNLGNTYNSLGDYQKAMTYLLKAVEINPLHSNAWYNLGISYKALGQYEQAISAYEKALQINPYRSDALYNLGNLYNSLGQYQKAITHYTKSIQINPNDADAYVGLGVAYKFLGQPQQAITHYQKAIQINPNDATAYNNLGKTYNSLGQHREAIAYYEKAVAIDTNDIETYNNLGSTYGLLGQHEQSIAYFKKAIQIDPNHGYAYHNLGTAYFYLKQYKEAKENFQKAKKLFQKAGDSQHVQEIDEDLKRLPFMMGFIKTLLQLGIFWGIFWIAFRFIMSHIFVERRTAPARYLSISLLLILASCAIPIIKINQESYSVMTFIFNGSIPFSIMFFGYLLSFLLLMKNDPNYDSASAVISFVSWIFSWTGNFRYVPNSAISENRILGLIWVSLYILLPMVNGLFYSSLIMAPVPSGKKRIGIWKLLDDWGSNGQLIREFAKKLRLDLQEGSGWKPSVAKGQVDTFDVEVTGAWLTGDNGVQLLTTRVTVLAKDKIFPKSVIFKRNSKGTKYILRSFIKGFSEVRENGLLIITSEADKDSCSNLISKSGYAVELAGLLKGFLMERSYYAPFVMIENNSVSFYKPFFASMSPALSVEDLEKIIKVLIRIIKAA